jgi:hypothetical protein
MQLQQLTSCQDSSSARTSQQQQQQVQSMEWPWQRHSSHSCIHRL